jgi:serine/threonine-protein kinase
MPCPAADRNLLFGILALQMDFITRDALIAAMSSWVLDKHRPIGEIMVEYGGLDPRLHCLLEQMVEAHLERHSGDPQESLAAVGAVGSVASDLRRSIADREVLASLDVLGSGQREDPYQTQLPTSDPTSPFVRFRKVREHAAGNLGVVYVARDEELNREVALKEIKERNADHLHSRAKFLLEAEVTGGLEHPGIVPVYGLGRYSDGRPFYAMRFIRGRSLLEAVNRFHAENAHDTDVSRRSLALQGLLRRFTDVCNAVAYAHSRGVLHRDLKPDNVMVGRYGETLVVDWGLAKACGVSGQPELLEIVDEHLPEEVLRPSTAESAEATQAGSLVGTPAYMSPEQASGRIDLMGPASDIYGLGATLYHVIVGQPPIQAATLGEALQKVRDGEIPRPRSLAPWLDPGLEAICLQAMAAKPDDRYRSARGLAEDLDRWMAGEAVSAYPEPWTRRAWRWAKRHRMSMLAAASVLLMVMVGLAIAQVIQSQANSALGAKNLELGAKNLELARANRRAEARFDLARDAIGSLKSVVTQDELLKNEELTGLRNKLLGTVAGFYERLDPLLQEQEDAQARTMLAQSYEELGRLIADIGRMPDALAAHEKALAIRRQLNALPDAGPDEARDLARSLIDVGDLETSRTIRDEKRWIQVLAEAREIAERLSATHADVAEYQELIAESLFISGKDRIWFGHPWPDKEAMELMSQALAIRERVASSHPELESNQRALAQIYYQLGFHSAGARWILAALDPALRYFRHALAIQERLAKTHPENLDDQLAGADTLIKIGEQLQEYDQRREALASFGRAQSILNQLAAAHPAVIRIQILQTKCHDVVAQLRQKMGDHNLALEALRANQKILERLAAAHPETPAYRRQQGVNFCNMVAPLAKLSRKVEARQSFERAQSILNELLKEIPVDASPMGLGSAFNELGRTASASGWYTDAVAAHRRAVSIGRRLARAPINFYLLARDQSLLAGAASRPGSGVSAEQARAEADLAVADLRRAIEAGYREFASMRVDADLDPIRGRPDVQALLLGPSVPAQPFAPCCVRDRETGEASGALVLWLRSGRSRLRRRHPLGRYWLDQHALRPPVRSRHDHAVLLDQLANECGVGGHAERAEVFVDENVRRPGTDFSPCLVENPTHALFRFIRREHAPPRAWIQTE